MEEKENWRKACLKLGFLFCSLVSLHGQHSVRHWFISADSWSGTLSLCSSRVGIIQLKAVVGGKQEHISDCSLQFSHPHLWPAASIPEESTSLQLPSFCFSHVLFKWSNVDLLILCIEMTYLFHLYMYKEIFLPMNNFKLILF